MLQRDTTGPAEPNPGIERGNATSQAASPEEATANVIADLKPRTVIARYPGHVWELDVTLCPFEGGIWAPWFPFAFSHGWPFFWSLAVILDDYSRKVIAVQVFASPHTAGQVRDTLDLALAIRGAPPKCIVSDKGAQFQIDCRDWCNASCVKPRSGALHRYGSIAIACRMMRTLKDEGLHRILLPISYEQMRDEVAAFAVWNNQHRAHQRLQSATPDEMFQVVSHARDGPRFEPRAKHPASGKLPARVPSAIRADRGTKLELVVDTVERRKHLPVVSLRPA